MVEFSRFDSRHYPTLPTREGYGEWAASYEDTVEDEMDLVLLDRLCAVPWADLGAAADLGCGTGRVGAWLRERGVTRLDGIDITPAMLERARSRGVYDTLREGDLLRSGLGVGAYGLVTTCLVDEHLRELAPLYREAARLLGEGGFFVLVGYHPFFIMGTGVPTHFDRASGESVAIETHVHLMSDHVAAAADAGLRLVEMRERVVDEEWIRLKPRWRRYRDLPVSFAMVWQGQ